VREVSDVHASGLVPQNTYPVDAFDFDDFAILDGAAERNWMIHEMGKSR
jgi:hypothetical protein